MPSSTKMTLMQGEMSVGGKSIALAVALCAACLLSFAAADVNLPSMSCTLLSLQTELQNVHDREAHMPR